MLQRLHPAQFHDDHHMLLRLKKVTILTNILVFQLSVNSHFPQNILLILLSQLSFLVKFATKSLSGLLACELITHRFLAFAKHLAHNVRALFPHDWCFVVVVVDWVFVN